ncbi:hypothetical protein MAC_09833 [Metarhizium acridum CQMa 102]|uniref:Uncharacterized protein n=1 Tax=Metarhizium acridum (strain CQMa 102) TaxID=655827 RepID=E9EIY5_METAQ|nr:uncharacterized protein MAC_09833 [Metarhizium acridum CQMa 102]EFY84122.1 hypothetical protein MAC_09833 [Metarhizium acridum CQMa 102]
MDGCVDPHCVLCTLEMKDGDAIVFVPSKEDPCSREGGLALACHLACAELGLPSLGTCRVMVWDPGFEESIARTTHLKRQLARTSVSTLDLARWTLQAEDEITEASSGEVTTSSCIWANYVTLHGETYVSALSNEPAEELVYDTETTSAADVIYIARGPLGVKKGLKIRNLRTDQHGDFQLPLWSAPFFRPGLVRFPLYPSSGPARFNRLTINDSGTTGYSVAWNPARRALRIARHTALDDVSCYANMTDDTTTWLHIPISRGELLGELWRRDCYLYRRKIVDLIIVTTAGRVHILGHHPTPGQAYTYSLVAKLRGQRDYLFIDDSAGIRELALTPAPEEVNETRNLRIPAPESCYPAITSVEGYFYTFAPLKNLDFIKICNFDGVVTGLLLHYHDGSRASVGQVRLDWLGAEQQVPNKATIRFAISRTTDQCPYVSSVLVFVARSARNFFPAKSDLDFEVTCYGNLEWWFTRRQCQLAHTGYTSASTRL